jgi:hypothetical protein
LNKCKEIQELRKYLVEKYGSANLIEVNYWEADLAAIGFEDRTQNYTIYISVYKHKKGQYFISLEDKSESDELLYKPAGDFDNISMEKLEAILIKHLRISN